MTVIDDSLLKDLGQARTENTVCKQIETAKSSLFWFCLDNKYLRIKLRKAIICGFKDGFMITLFINIDIDKICFLLFLLSSIIHQFNIINNRIEHSQHANRFFPSNPPNENIHTFISICMHTNPDLNR